MVKAVIAVAGEFRTLPAAIYGCGEPRLALGTTVRTVYLPTVLDWSGRAKRSMVADMRHRFAHWRQALLAAGAS